MSFLNSLITVLLHVDTYLKDITDRFGILTYGVLFLIIFIETGVVVMPFLPGDSLIFTAGAFAGMGIFNIFLLFIAFAAGAIIGDTTNYFIGKSIGPRAFTENNRFFKKEYLQKAQDFYKKHGGIAIILSRFIPIVRTFAPFVAGISNMDYAQFISYNIIGGLAWVSLFLFGGYALGNVPFIKDNMHYTVVIILVASVIPIIFEFIRSKLAKQDAPADAKAS